MQRRRLDAVSFFLFVSVYSLGTFQRLHFASSFTSSLARQRNNVASSRRFMFQLSASISDNNNGHDYIETLVTQQTSQQQQEHHHVTIEYCTGCRWMMRSAWMAQELLTTFQDELDGVTLIPSRPPNPGGVFSVRAFSLGYEPLNVDATLPFLEAPSTLLWDRKEKGGFPELKHLKQILRDVVAPKQFLGHSDTQDRKQQLPPEGDASATGNTNTSDWIECQSQGDFETSLPASPTTTASAPAIPNPALTGNNVAITYCTGCRWLLRAAWMGQELLTTFDTQLTSLTLIPSRPPQKGGTYTVVLNGEMVWNRAQQGRFPDVKELKQLIRDRVDPEKDLGHSDDKDRQQELTEEEAEQLRNFYGVQ